MSPHPDSTSSASPSKIVDVAIGYMAAKQLFAASEAGLFAALAEGPATVAEISARTGLPERTARILADAMSSLDLLTRADGVYTNSPSVARYLAGSKDDVDLRPFLGFLDAISYGHWLGFGQTARTALPGNLDISGDRLGTFMSGVMTYNALHAKMLAENFDFSPFKKVLDFGGLSASFLSEALAANPELNGTFFSGGPLVESAKGVLAEAGLGDRIEVVEGDILEGDIPTGFDLVLLEHVAHRYDDEQNKLIAKRAREAAAPGAKLLLLDFFLDGDENQRAIDALHAGEYLVIDGTIVYPEDQVRGWLTDAGWEPVETRALPGSPRIIIAEAR
ncbi:methyltransferase [Streptosporangium carneum]|uniref:SAM-dependent methyltransferase n=1 Tax=Streptosporangium carneum TaxID=47481 RepID=A0A9W6IAR3_9ACTN|nr:methyltransferase [Streptosporangium carneum]GLK15227.1 SAM-dependent methyltransferase [Streptosporangium carneum]